MFTRIGVFSDFFFFFFIKNIFIHENCNGSINAYIKMSIFDIFITSKMKRKM